MAWRFHGCTCEPCLEFGRQFRERTIDLRQDAARAREFSQRMQDRHGSPWTAEEIEVVCDLHIRVLDAALELGRTAKAVQSARRRFLNP